jgi:hypothetical protein
MLEHYNPILTTIKDLCPTAHIGGGAVRDTLLERPIKDIDLFLDDAATDEAATLLRSQHGFVKVGEWKQYHDFSDPAVARLAKFEKADEVIPVCLIGLKRARDMKDNLARFDFGICMAAWDGKKTYVAPEYNIDVENKTFTLTRADNEEQFNYSMSRFRKMAADRYAGWKLIVPLEFGKFALPYAEKRAEYQYDQDLKVKFQMSFEQQLKPKDR